MANTYRVDSHPKKTRIIRDLINQVPYETIANNYGLTFSSVQRYASQKLRLQAAKALKKGYYDGANLLSRIEDTIVYVQKMYEACDEWLTDPDDPSSYTLDSRADEIKVIYDEHYTDTNGEDKYKKKTEDLQTLLDKALTEDDVLILVETKKADPRKLVLDTANTMSKQLELLAKIAGVVQDQVTNINIDTVNTAVISSIIQVIESEVSDQPELLKKLVQGIANAAK